MWHVSSSVWSGRSQRKLCLPIVAQKAAIAALVGVGGEREWWFWNPDVRVGHLRIGVTTAEYAAMPPGEAFDDAGETGPERRRRRM